MPRGEETRKSLPFSTQRSNHWFHVIDVRATVGCCQILQNCTSQQAKIRFRYPVVGPPVLVLKVSIALRSR